jgi:uncharacterized membrane protein YfcA
MTGPEFVAAGFLAGILVGLTGVGGGSVMTPLLVLMNVNPLVAVGTDLLYSMPTRLYGAYLHARNGNVDWFVVRALLIGGVPSAALGFVALVWLRAHFGAAPIASWTRPAIGFAVVASALAMLAQPMLSRRLAPLRGASNPHRRAVALGAIVGAIVSTTSIGSGSITLPMLALVFPAASAARLVGSDIAFAALLIPFAALGRWSLGDVNASLTMTLLAGSLPGVWVGSKLCARLQRQWLRPAVAITLIFVGMRMV